MLLFEHFEAKLLRESIDRIFGPGRGLVCAPARAVLRAAPSLLMPVWPPHLKKISRNALEGLAHLRGHRRGSSAVAIDVDVHKVSLRGGLLPVGEDAQLVAHAAVAHARDPHPDLNRETPKTAVMLTT